MPKRDVRKRPCDSQSSCRVSRFQEGHAVSKTFWCLLILLASALPNMSFAQELTLEIGRTYENHGPRTLVPMTNNSNDSVHSAEISCAWFSSGKAVAMATGLLDNIPRGGDGTEEIWANQQTRLSYDSVKCRVGSVITGRQRKKFQETLKTLK